MDHIEHTGSDCRRVWVAALVAAPTHIAVPLQLRRGKADKALLKPWHTEAIPASLLTGHQYEVVPNAGGCALLAACSDIFREHVPEICAGPPGFDRAACHIRLQQIVAGFFRTPLDTC